MHKKAIKKELFDLLKSPDYKPQTKNELVESLGLTERKDKRHLKDILYREKIHDRIIKDDKGRYFLPVKLSGQLLANTRGFGFVRPDNELFDEDIFVSPQNLGGAFDKDKVIVEVFQNPIESHRAEGRIIEVTERGNKRVVGTFDKHESASFVITDNDKLNKDIYIPIGEELKAKHGDKVVVEVTNWATGHKNPEGKVIEILGQKGTPGVDIMSIIKGFDVPMEFPEAVLEEAESFNEIITAEELEKRRDFRELTTFTIDGDNSKDFDDAVSIKRLDNGNYELGVHIADVSHFVTPNSQLDKEAAERGTSIYAVNKVVPMLPEALSNNLCSLVPDQDRLTYSCVMEVTPKGEVVDYDIHKSVIHSHARMTYNSVNAFLDGVADETTAYLRPFKDDLETMVELAQILREERRGARGAIDFDFPEAYIEVDENGKPVEVNLRERGVSEKLIEEFMLLANETVAKHAAESGLTFMYRNHPHPDTEKLKEFRNFIGKFGFKLGKHGQLPTNGDYQQLMKDIKGTPYEKIITLLALRTMQQALYEAENKGHFALGAENYTHFTSPIRRYPDLTVHRNLGLLEEGKTPEDAEVIEVEEIIEDQASHSSATERTAEEIEREVEKLKKAEYMKERIGERFTGTISGVTGFGIFVELPNTVEGLVRMSSLSDDYYNFDEDLHQLTGENFGGKYRLGDTIDVIVSDVDVDARRIDFEPAVPRTDKGNTSEYQLGIKHKHKDQFK